LTVSLLLPGSKARCCLATSAEDGTLRFWHGNCPPFSGHDSQSVLDIANLTEC
jgi:hypothetical protein